MDGLHRDLIREKVNGSVCERDRGVCGTWCIHCRRQAHFKLIMSDRGEAAEVTRQVLGKSRS